MWLVDGYSGPELISITGSSSPDSTSKKANPLFVDAANGDFRLQANSPAIDAATNVDLSWANALQDVYGNLVSKGSARDIGAAEY